MDTELNNYKSVNIILEITAIYCFLESYLGDYFWKGFYAVSARVYVLIFIWLGIMFLLNGNNLKISAKYLYYFFIVCVASFLMNFSSLTGILFYIKIYLFPFLILYWIRQVGSDRLLKIVVVLFLINILLNVGWLLHLNPFPNAYKNTLDDFAIGTVGTAFFAFISILFILYGYIYKKKLFMFFSGFALLMSNSLALFGIFIPVIISATKFKIKYYILLLFITLSLVLSFIYLMPDIYKFTTNRLEIVSDLKFAKFELYTEMYESFAKHPLNLLFGFGPGERSSFASEQANSKFYNNNITYFSDKYYVDGGSIMDKYYSGIASIIWETGIAGLICLFLLFKKFLLNENFTKREKRLNIAFMVLFFLWLFVMDIFRNSNLSILYIMFAGILSNGIESQVSKLKAKSPDNENNIVLSPAELRIN